MLVRTATLKARHTSKHQEETIEGYYRANKNYYRRTLRKIIEVQKGAVKIRFPECLK